MGSFLLKLIIAIKTPEHINFSAPLYQAINCSKLPGIITELMIALPEHPVSLELLC